MNEPKNLEFDVLQSENFVEESYPGAGDGKGWRMCKNGDFQICTSSCVGGEIFTKYGNVRVDARQFELGFDPDKQRYLDEKHMREAGIEPSTNWPKRVYLTQEQIEAAKCALPGHIVHKPGAGKGVATICDLEVVVRIDMPEGVDVVKAQGYAHSIRQIVMDTVNSSEVLKGMRSGSGRITDEETVRAESDMALGARVQAMSSPLAGIGAGLDLGKECLYVEQPGGPVAIGDLQKCCGRDKFTEQFLNREVRSDLKPEVACALSMAAPMTANGKVPLNNLPRPVDDDK